jgi:hypothetical protein
VDGCHVAARPGEAGHKTKLDRVFGSDEDDGDRRGCRLCCERCTGTSGRSNHGDLAASQLGRQLRKSIDLILGPAVYDRHVLALDIAGVLQALAKCAQSVRVGVRQCGVEEPDNRHRRLLRARREWPGRRSIGIRPSRVAGAAARPSEPASLVRFTFEDGRIFQAIVAGEPAHQRPARPIVEHPADIFPRDPGHRG